MGSWLLLATASASIFPLALSHWFRLGGEEATAALFGLSLCPWMVLIGLPKKAAPTEPLSALLILAHAAPVLGLAWALDSSAQPSTAGLPAAWQGACLAAIYLSVLAFAASRAAGRSRWHGCVWILLVLIAPILGGLMTSFAGSDPGSPTAIGGDALASWSPLSLCMRIASGDSAAFSPTTLACTGASLAILVAAAEWDRRRP